MSKKKKFKLKKKFRKVILLLILIAFVIIGGIKLAKTFDYHGTVEYKLIKCGYTKEETKILISKLSKKNIKKLETNDKIDYMSTLVNEKYFIDDNLDKYLDFYRENSKKSFSDVVAIVNVGATKDWYEDIKETDISKGSLILVNKFNALTESYDPGNIKKFSATYAYGEVSAEETTYNAFIEMAKAAKKDGITLILTSGYRSNAKQKKIYDDMKNTKGEKYADEYAARPGSSEHETGLSLDILTYGGLTETFKDTPTYAWLASHASEYGFIERYPEGKEYLTGYAAESWHYRYVGIETAKKIAEEGITFDEYYAFYLAR